MVHSVIGAPLSLATCWTRNVWQKSVKMGGVGGWREAYVNMVSTMCFGPDFTQIQKPALDGFFYSVRANAERRWFLLLKLLMKTRDFFHSTQIRAGGR